MSRSTDRVRRARIAAWIALAALTQPALARAQAPVSGVRTPAVIAGVEGDYGAPLRGAAGGSLFIPIGRWHCGDGLCGGRGAEIHGRAGAGGWRLAGGAVMMAFPFWADVLVTATRTSAASRGASPDSTYVGVEAGLAFPVYEIHQHFLMLRPSIGVAHRAQGPPGPDGTTVTWGVGLHVLRQRF